MATVLDHTQDLTGRETYRLTQLYAPPEFVKTAKHASLHGDPETLPTHVYADQRNRLYPCHTKAATWMSTLFFADKRAEYKPAVATVIESRLDKAASYFHIKADCDALKQKVAADSVDDANRLPDSEFALVWVTDGARERHYPLRNAAEVKMASAWFQTYRDQFLFADRSRIAQKILEKASQYGADISEQRELLGKVAGYGYCSGVEIADMLQKRASLVARSHPTYAAEMRQLATQVEKYPQNAREAGVREKLASIVDQFDRQTQLNRMYDEGGLERPEEVLFKVTEKAAQDFVHNHFQLTSGTVYEKAAFDKLSLDHIEHWMGSDFAREVSAGGLLVDVAKMADIAATLPRGDAEMFDRMAQSAGVGPLAVEKAAHATGLGLEELYALADQCPPSQPVL